MSNLFYDHLIVIEEIEAVVGKNKKILDLCDEILQHEILDTIFSYLPKEHHEEFLQIFLATPNSPKLLEYLKDHSAINIELAILDRANKTKRRILKLLPVEKPHRRIKNAGE